jgi:DNA mismatch repair protein MutL
MAGWRYEESNRNQVLLSEAQSGPSPAVQLLDPNTINQIAAGEVVERPASVVKELVENALDSGAQRIDVVLEESGKQRIAVADDGCGMSLENARLALLRHATSKIGSLDDLQTARTLGFRGEALPSIASVSRLTLRTTDMNGSRFVLQVEGGEITEFERVAGPRGTEVVVEDLFYNTPARLKFLKSDTTELGQCMDVVSRLALAYPHVSISLKHNGFEAFRTSGSGDLLVAIQDVWSRDLARALAEADTEAAGIRVTGFLSPPHVTRPNRAYQFLSVNGRPVKSRNLTIALDQAYRDLTPDRRFPVAALDLAIDPAKVDINVSPTKSEVRFQHEGAAFDALRMAVRSALMEHGMMPSLDGISNLERANAALVSSMPSPWESVPSAPLAGISGLSGPSSEFLWPYPRRDGGETLVEDGALAPKDGPVGQTLSVGPSWAPGVAIPLDQTRFPFSHLLDGLRVIGQAMNTFILAETHRGIVVIDQHVAHERVLYELLCGLRGPTAIEVQTLLIPLTLHLDRRAAILLHEQLDELAAIGFQLEAFGGESYVVRAVPAAIRGNDPLRFLRDLVDELVDSTVQRKLVPTREQLWITSACRMAVKAGDPLGIAEMEKLIEALATTENPYLCPHGRPITLTMTTEELLRKFKRLH